MRRSWRELQPFCEGLRWIALATVEEPIDGFADIVFSGFAHDAGDGLAGFVENDGAGDDVAEAEAGERVRVGVDPGSEVHMKFGERGRDLFAVFGFVDGDEHKGDGLAGVGCGDLGETGKFFLAGAAPRSPEVDDQDLAAKSGEFARLSVESFESWIGNTFGKKGSGQDGKEQQESKDLAAGEGGHCFSTIKGDGSMAVNRKVEMSFDMLGDAG